MATITKTTVEKTGEVRYRAQIRMRGRKSISKTFLRRRDAERWAKETESAIQQNLYLHTAEAEKHTLGELINRYLDEVMPEKKSGRTQRQQLQWWRDELGERLLTEMNPAVLTEVRERLTRGRTPAGKRRSPATVVRYLAALSHVFTVAVKEWQWMDDNPLMKMRKPKEPRGRVRFLDEEERIALLSACQESANPHLYPIVLLALSTGMRQGEILKLRWQDVDLEKGRAVLHDTKNGERRGVPLLGMTLGVLQDIYARRAPPSRRALLFPSHANPAKPMDITRPWRVAITKADIADFRFHDLRHTAASYLAMSGASLTEIAAVLGHKTLSMVKRYAHISDAHTAGVLARMNERFLK